jgi:hypothetical protein
MKWLAWMTLAFVFYDFLTGDTVSRLYLVAIYSNYLLFFGPAQLGQLKRVYRRWDYQRKLRR